MRWGTYLTVTPGDKRRELIFRFETSTGNTDFVVFLQECDFKTDEVR